MSDKTFLKVVVVLVLIVGIGLAVGEAWDLRDVVQIMFSDKPRSKTSGKKTPSEPTGPSTVSPQPQNQDEQKVGQLITGLERIAGVASGQSTVDSIPTQAIRPQDSARKVRWAPPPPGFLTADTFNYLIYRQDNPVTANIKTVLDTIHGNLMLDLTPFTLVVKPNKILVMLFENRTTYHDFTHLPDWSGAASDLQSDTMYVVEGNSFYPLSVHELTHLYFDGYFLPTISPLWLSEGMAVYMQIYATKQKPGWIDHSLRRILSGDIIPLDEMTTTEDLNSYDTSRAELWYTQAYSLVDYLLNRRTRDEFYKLCTELKNKVPLHQALYHTYGMPFNKVSVLQNVWLHDLQKAYQEGRILVSQPLSAMVKQTPPADGMMPAAASSMLATPAPAVAVSAAQPPAPGAQETSGRAPVTKPAAQSAPVPSSAKPATQKTKINKLQTVDPRAYWGGS